MKFTLEQYNSNIQDWYLDDFPVPSNDNFMFELFNLLPNRLQGIALSWSGSDSVFREDVFKYLIQICFQLTVKEFYFRKLNLSAHLSLEFIANKITEYENKS